MATVVVPCAGAGTRLNRPGLPKALTPFGGTTLLGHVLGRIAHPFRCIVVVVNPEQEQVFRAAIRLQVPPEVSRRVRLAFQPAALGSLDAVIQGLAAVDQADDVVVVWGDQVGVSIDTVLEVLRELSSADVVVPVVSMGQPYVWLEMDGDRLVRVGRARDGDAPPAVGLADLGVFGLSPAAQAYLPACSAALSGAGAPRELDFTYALPLLGGTLRVRALPRSNPDEALAVNSPHDLQRALERFGMSPDRR